MTSSAPVAAPPPAHVFAASFPPEPSRVAEIRHGTAAHLQRWNLAGPLIEKAVLVVSELVTNALQHGDGNVVLHVSSSAQKLRIEVTDGTPTPATLCHPQASEGGGRGLYYGFSP